MHAPVPSRAPLDSTAQISPTLSCHALPSSEAEEESSADFFVALLVPRASPLVGQTVRQGGLLAVEGLSLVSVK